MAKLPIYTQRYQAKSRRADAEDFGAATGRAQEQLGQSVQGLGDALAQIEDRRRNRKDTIDRVRAINEYSQIAQQEMTRLSTESDIADTKVPGQYNQFLGDELERIVQEHAGSDGSRDELRAQLMSHQGRYAQDLYKASTTAQFKLMNDHVTTTIKGLADIAGDMPDSTLNQMAALDETVDQMAAALTPEQEAALRESGKSQILSSAMNTQLIRGDFDAADALLSTEGVAEILTPDAMRQIKSKIIIGRNEKDKAEKAFQNKINAIESVAGVKLSAVQKLQLAGLSATNRPQTISEKIAEFEQVTGSAATKDQIAQFYGLDAGNGTTDLYGKSLRGRAMGRLDENVGAFQAGILGGEGDQRFVTDVIEAYGPKQIRDPITGTIVNVPGTPAPPHIKAALNARGLGHVLQPVTDDPSFQTGDPDAPIPYLEEGQEGIWQLVPKLAGPVAAVEGVVEGTPFFGGATEQDITMAKQRVVNLRNSVVTALQNNPKFAEGEREAIKQELDILPGIWSNPENAMAKLIAMDSNLEDRQNAEFKTMNDKSLPADVRKGAASKFTLLTNVRSQLNLPPTVSPEEVVNLAPGTVFITNDGRVMRAKGKDAQQEQPAGRK